MDGRTDCATAWPSHTTHAILHTLGRQQQCDVLQRLTEVQNGVTERALQSQHAHAYCMLHVTACQKWRAMPFLREGLLLLLLLQQAEVSACCCFKAATWPSPLFSTIANY